MPPSPIFEPLAPILQKMNLEKLFQDLVKYQKEEIKTRELTTPDFNGFQILSPKETQISRFLGELLDENGSHLQGKLFQNLFFEKLIKTKTPYKNSNKSDLYLEYSIGNGQIDILLVFDDKFAVAIENKPFANDQDEQIVRYCNFMKRKFGEDNFLMIYLSANGSAPTEKSLTKEDKERLGNKFSIISFPQIRIWLIACLQKLKEKKTTRLIRILEEFTEYINLEFRKQNDLKNTPIYETLKDNIISAHQITSLWNENLKKFEEIYTDKINQLFNKELPKLVFEDLKNKNVIDNNWEFIEGDFDLNKAHFKGWAIKKKKWKSSCLAIYSNRIGYSSNSKIRSFYPLIISKEKIKRIDYNNHYCNLTKSEIMLNEEKKFTKFNILNQKLNEVWWTLFPDKEFQFWNDETWIEIKPNGKTVNYISSFLENLINASSSDIDEIENVEESKNNYTEKEFEEFINQFQWTFAKTYADKAPHEYIVLSKVGLIHKDEFIKIAQFIRDKGFKAYYYSREGYYYKIGENYYWTMDEKVEDTDLINRAKWDDYELINNKWNWKGEKTGANKGFAKWRDNG